MVDSAKDLFNELSNPEFIDRCMSYLDESEKKNDDAILAVLTVNVDEYANEIANLGVRYNDISFTDIANVAKSLLVGIKHGYSVAPPSNG